MDATAQLYKKECTDRGCGPLCAAETGCLNYHNISRYLIVVECEDAYGSTATGTLTVNIQENQPPVFTNLPMTITVNTQDVADEDVVFTFYYTDDELETLIYNYTLNPTNASSLFDFDLQGNFNNNPANVTALIHQWQLGNETYVVYVCVTERRNTVCDTLTINQRNYCGPTPSCLNDHQSVTDQTGSGVTLFTINVPSPATGTYTSLSYSISSADILLFEVDGSGNVLSRSTLPVKNPPDPTTYSIVAYVYDTAACEINVCHLSLDVSFTNFDISIDNVDGATFSLHEDTEVENTLITISTSDNNTDDSVTCVIDEANSLPANNGKFLTRETSAGSNIYMILNKAHPGFDFNVTNSYTVAVTCSDTYGSSASASMTVTIDENQEPVLNNLPAGTSISVDPVTVYSGSTVFTLNATDVENDALTYYCNVSSSLEPLQCNSVGAVSLRRNVSISENGTSYTMTLCVIESTHSHTVCGDLSVLFTTSKAQPEISNLPATVPFNEATSVGTTLYTVGVSDTDVGDVHTFTLGYVRPVGSASMFSFSSSSGVLTLASSFDYETQTTFNLTFSVEDTYLPGLAYKTLYLQVTDVNEAPTLTLYTIYLNTSEGNLLSNQKNVKYIVWEWVKAICVSLSSGTYLSFFNMEPTSGRLTLAQNWDLETGTLPQSTVLEVTCSDGVGLTDAGTFTVYIDAVNEFAPVPSITEVELTIYSNQTLQHTLFSVTATDADFNDDGKFVFSIVGNGIGSQFFTMSNTGDLTLTDYILWTYNYTFHFTVEISDNETSPLTGSVNVIIAYIAPEPTQGPVRGSKCLLCTTEGTLVFATICGCSALIVILCIHACCRTKAWRMCQSEPIRIHEQDLKNQRRRKKKREMLDMIHEIDKDEDGDSDDNAEYKPQADRLKGALPSQPPPKRFMYLGARDIRQGPKPINYIGPDIELKRVPEPNIVPDHPVTSEPARGQLYGNSNNPVRLFQPNVAPPARDNSMKATSRLFDSPANVLHREKPTKRKMRNQPSSPFFTG